MCVFFKLAVCLHYYDNFCRINIFFPGSLNKTTSDEDLTCLANRKNNFENGTLIEENADQGLDWDEKTRGLVLGAFSIGYLSTQVRSTS